MLDLGSIFRSCRLFSTDVMIKGVFVNSIRNAEMTKFMLDFLSSSYSDFLYIAIKLTPEPINNGTADNLLQKLLLLFAYCLPPLRRIICTKMAKVESLVPLL